MSKTVIIDIFQNLPILGVSGSEVTYFIPDPSNFSEVSILSDHIKKLWLKETQKEIKNIINNQNFLFQEPEKGDPVSPCMDAYKAKIQFYGSLDKIKLRIMVRGNLQNNELVGYTWSPTDSMRTLKYFLADAFKHKARVHQLDFIGASFKAKFNNGVFLKLDSRYTD